MTAHAWTSPIPYFPASELASPDTGEIRLDIRFAIALPSLRQELGRPLSPSSVCRTPEHNVVVEGHPRSLHLTINPVHPTFGSMAADLLWLDWSHEHRVQFCRLAWRRGWSLGLANTFVHVDRRADAGLEKAIYAYSGWAGRFGSDEIVGALA